MVPFYAFWKYQNKNGVIQSNIFNYKLFFDVHINGFISDFNGWTSRAKVP